MNIITVIGARPQFVKAAVVSRAIQSLAAQGMPVREHILHTGQHYDANMSDLFFTQLGIPAPQWHLNRGNSIREMQEAIVPVLATEKPDIVLVYGDTNSTLAGALAAHALRIPIAHIEAGLRSFNTSMPEETNRIETDRLSRWLFCPTSTAVQNLRNEHITQGVHHVGDVMYDAALLFMPAQSEQEKLLQQYNLTSKSFALATIHRAATAENEPALHAVFEALSQLPMPVILPLHPHTAKTVNASALLQQQLQQATNIHLIEPVGYREMLVLERHANCILTDSGGMQKEAYFQRTPCITLREETEWTETVQAGWNQLAGTDTERILQAFRHTPNTQIIKDYGNGHSAEKIVQLLCPNASSY